MVYKVKIRINGKPVSYAEYLQTDFSKHSTKEEKPIVIVESKAKL